ncbi:MAG TPA: 2-succinyl-5-enolpyruvyl-6-hydroxy-3-cyclohexene-1-carboxylic-acid synthase [Opitutae bacterium]|nr:2-succinyl-5-enolpyruvyl-6-hydroxy-3-cyclohexene-1-carboxylic-acid synthase [Opitutae bacterium]
MTVAAQDSLGHEASKFSRFHPLLETNHNMLASAVIFEVLARLGVRMVVLSPGSRSAPLAIACNLHPLLEVVPILDERSAAFFALGHARQTGIPTVLLCTSGTAVANFHPAVLEASVSGVPLIVLTADRPPELRDCHERQTVDQVKIYGHAPRWQCELGIPEPKEAYFRYLRQVIRRAWEKTLFQKPGPVHINIPFQEPLVPSPVSGMDSLVACVCQESFFNVPTAAYAEEPSVASYQLSSIAEQMRTHERGIIVVSQQQWVAPEPYIQALAELSSALAWPILSDFLTPLRGYADRLPTLVSSYDTILRNEAIAEALRPDCVLSIGAMPISKVLRPWLEGFSIPTWVLDSTGDNYDPLHRAAVPIRCSLPILAKAVGVSTPKRSSYLGGWLDLETQASSAIAERLEAAPPLFEGKVVQRALAALPQGTPVFIASSMPVRDAEFFGVKGSHRIKPYFNRGADGIDGTLSTAMGMAHGNKPSVLIVGDLALLHGISGFLLKDKLEGSLTVLVINNDGGRIFENLPIAECEGVPFEECFTTPQSVDIPSMAEGFGWNVQCIHTLDEMEASLQVLPDQGVSLLHVCTDSTHDVPFRRELFRSVAESL